jgi:GT2 family glycosyltransferase
MGLVNLCLWQKRLHQPGMGRLRLALKFLGQGNLRAFRREYLAAVGAGPEPSDYVRWRELHRITPRDRRGMRQTIDGWAKVPRISVVGGSDSNLRLQIYPHWQVESIEQATGDYVCFVDPGDEFAEHALFRVAEAIVADPSRDVIYSDEDRLSETGEHVDPFFKPDWSPEYFLAWMYTGRLAAYRRELARDVGGIRPEFGDAAEYDLMLRLIAAGAKVHHIPDVLYHRRKERQMTDSARALQTYLDATGRGAVVEPGLAPEVHRVRFAIKGEPLVSIVIPSACRPVKFQDRESWFVLECVSSIRRLSTYKNIEIIAVDNNDMSDDLAAALKPLDIVRVPFLQPFNLTRKINLGASRARGEQLLLLNDDVEVITPDWIEAMLEFSQQAEIGAVGVQLLFPDDTQQHTGVVILDGNPRHPFYHEPKDHPGYFYSSVVHRDCAAVTGACTMTRREVFEGVGGYSERFPLSYNDIDYCLKVLELGKRVVYTPHAKLYHHESVSRPLTKPDHVNAFKEYWSARFPRDPYYNPNLGRHYRVRV